MAFAKKKWRPANAKLSTLSSSAAPGATLRQSSPRSKRYQPKHVCHPERSEEATSRRHPEQLSDEGSQPVILCATILDGILRFAQDNEQLEFRQHDSLLRLILPLLVLVRNLALFIRFEENYLAQSFIRVNLRRQRSRIADFQRHKSFPFRLERRHVHDNPAARVRRLPHADRQTIPRNPEIFHRSRQRG